MNNNLSKLIEKYRHSHELLEACQLATQQAYPKLLLRWSRIYGSRWAYLTGNTETVCLHPLRYNIGSEYGICIDNADILAPNELEDMIQTLKECICKS